MKKAMAAIPNPPPVALDDLIAAELHTRQYSEAAKRSNDPRKTIRSALDFGPSRGSAS
jgi:hypothetical protein